MSKYNWVCNMNTKDVEGLAPFGKVNGKKYPYVETYLDCIKKDYPDMAALSLIAIDDTEGLFWCIGDGESYSRDFKEITLFEEYCFLEFIMKKAPAPIYKNRLPEGKDPYDYEFTFILDGSDPLKWI